MDMRAPYSATSLSNNVKFTEKTIKNVEKVMFPHGTLGGKRITRVRLLKKKKKKKKKKKEEERNISQRKRRPTRMF